MSRHDGNDSLPRVDQLLVGIFDAPPCLVPFAEQAPKALMAAIDAESESRRIQLDLWVVQAKTAAELREAAAS